MTQSVATPAHRCPEPVLSDPRALAAAASPTTARSPAATRKNRSFTAGAEKRLLEAMARHAPRWLTSDQLTLAGLLAQCAAGALYMVARVHPLALLAVNAAIAVNWLGDSLDGTLARVRQQQRPRFGFYVDHVVDLVGSAVLMTGLAGSGFLHPVVAAAMLLAFLLLAAESYLATHSLGRFQLSAGMFGPTELRLLLIAGNGALLRGPWVHVPASFAIFRNAHRVLLFDLGGSIGAAAMLATFAITAVRHTTELSRLEPLPAARETR